MKGCFFNLADEKESIRKRLEGSIQKNVIGAFVTEAG